MFCAVITKSMASYFMLSLRSRDVVQCTFNPYLATVSNYERCATLNALECGYFMTASHVRGHIYVRSHVQRRKSYSEVCYAITNSI